MSSPLGDAYEKIVFLYQLEPSRVGKSYGLNVAALVGLSDDLLSVAGKKSRELQHQAVDDPYHLQVPVSSIEAFQHIATLVDSRPASFSDKIKSILSMPT